jgi:hypothetical protein
MRRLAALLVVFFPIGGIGQSAGGELRPLALGRAAEAPIWSADGRFVAFPRFELSGNRLSIFDAATGAERPLPFDTTYYRFVPAPSGSRVAIQYTNHVNVVSLADGSTQTLTPTHYSFSWAPDGRRFVSAHFVVGTRDDYRIVVGDLETGERRDIGAGYLADWSPDGTEIAVLRRTGNTSTAYAVRVDGSGERTLGTAPTGLSSASLLEWAPDGRSVAIALWSQLVLVGEGPEVVVPSPYPGRLIWAPDSDLLAVLGFEQALVVSRDGGRRLDLRGVRGIGWSGRELLYGDGTGVFGIPSSGGQPREIAHAAAFALSPGGDALALAVSSDHDSDCLEDQLVVVRISSGVRRSLGVCWIDGSARGDRLRGRDGGDEIDGFGGADRIEARGGDDLVRGWDGADALYGGGGRDQLSGGPGRDRLFARDGELDRVACGTGFDRAVVDRADDVARNCERVSRR